MTLCNTTFFNNKKGGGGVSHGIKHTRPYQIVSGLQSVLEEQMGHELHFVPNGELVNIISKQMNMNHIILRLKEMSRF